MAKTFLRHIDTPRSITWAHVSVIHIYLARRPSVIHILGATAVKALVAFSGCNKGGSIWTARHVGAITICDAEALHVCARLFNHINRRAASECVSIALTEEGNIYAKRPTTPSHLRWLLLLRLRIHYFLGVASALTP